MIPISEHSADSCAPEEQQRTLNSGIVENRVKLSHKDHQRHGAVVGCNFLGKMLGSTMKNGGLSMKNGRLSMKHGDFSKNNGDLSV